MLKGSREMSDRPRARPFLRFMCLIAAMANLGGNVFILLFYRPVFAWLNVPLPQDIFSFTFVCGFSFTAGVLALMVYRDPDGNKNLLPVGFIGKGIYAFLTFISIMRPGFIGFTASSASSTASSRSSTCCSGCTSARRIWPG